MKYIIVGLHCTGKMKIAKILRDNDISVGSLMTNADISSELSQHNLYKQYPIDDMNLTFENNAYIFFKDLNDNMMNEYECLSSFEFDNNDVFILSPHHLNAIPKTKISKDKICFIWLDNNTSNREMTHIDENRKYSFHERERFESKDIHDFVEKIYTIPNSEMIYFWNEEPARVATIIELMIRHPECRDKIIQNFN